MESAADATAAAPATGPCRARAAPPRARGLSKRYGGLVALADYALDLPAGTHPRRHRPQRRRQDHAVQPALGHGQADHRHASSSTGREITALPPAAVARRASRGRSRTSACSMTCRSSTTSGWPASATSRAVLGGDAVDARLPSARARETERARGAAGAGRPGRSGATRIGRQPALWRPAAAGDRPRAGRRAARPHARRAQRGHEPDRDGRRCWRSSAASATSWASPSSSSPTTSRWSWTCATASRCSTSACSSRRASRSVVRNDPAVVAAYLGQARHA